MKLDKLNLDGKKDSIEVLDKIFSAKINKKLIFPDHYKFNKSELLDIINEAEKEKLKIIMTEKDFNKVNDFRLEKINYLKVSLEIENQEKFFKRIMKLYV